MKPRAWFRFQNAASDPTVAEIYVIDIIGDWIDELINEYYGMKATLTAKGFLDQLSKLDASVKTIRVSINTPGGDVFAALNIANALRDQQATKGRTVETIVTGLAASAGSIIAMAGSKVTMSDNGLMMIHQPWSGSVGNAKQMRADADTLDIITKTLVATYQWHSQLDDAAIVALLDGKDGVDGTWLTADEAIASGFATDKIAGLTAAASIDRRTLASLKVPEQFKARVDALLKPEELPAPAPVAADAMDILAAVDTAKLHTGFARELVAAKLPMADVTARITAEVSKRQISTVRAEQIRSFCATAKLPTLADGYINSAMSVKDVQQHLTDVTASMDKAVIDTGLQPDADGRTKKTIDSTAIYAGLNTPKSK